MRRTPTIVLLLVVGCAQLLGLDHPTLQQAPQPDAAPRPDAPAPVILTVTLTGTGGGVVTSQPGDISCPGKCSAVFPHGSSVLLTASQNGGSTFVGWSEASCGGAPSCRVSLTGETRVDAELRDNAGGHNFAFVTEENLSVTRFSPLSAADAVCNDSARAARLPGSYVAWLSDSVANAKDRIPTSARGWVRTDGLPVVDRLTDLLAGRIYHPIDRTARGTANEGTGVITGTLATGLGAGKYCNDYTTAEVGQQGWAGYTQETTNGWTNSGDWGCQYQAHLYCFGVDKSTALEKPANAGRIVFVSTRNAVPAPTGVLAADEACRLDAADASLPGTYKAFLATAGASAASRFASDVRPFVRPDGVVVTAAGGSIFDPGDLRATINVTAAGEYLPNALAHSGASSPDLPGTTATTCGDWKTGGGKEQCGAITNTRVWFTNGPTVDCQPFFFTYCVQE